MDFKELLLQAQEGQDAAVEILLQMYRPLLVKSAIINSRFDEDLYQELCVTMLKCIRVFRV